MAVKTLLLNGTNLTRDDGIASYITSFMSEGVRGGFGNDLAITLNQCDTGMAFIQATRTSVTPNEQFLVPVWVDTAEVIDTSGDGFIIIELDQAKINDGSGNSADGTGIATVKKVASLPTSNYIQLASLASGVITDTRTNNAFDISQVTADTLLVDTINEKTASNGVLIDGMRVIDDYLNFTEKGSAPSTPASGEWRLYFKADGLYILEDTGSETKLLAGGISTTAKAEASASNGEMFENTDKGNNFSWKRSTGEVYEFQESYQLGESFSAGDAACLLGVKSYGGSDISVTEDTYVDADAATTNYVTATRLHVRNNNEETYLDFDFSGITDLHRLVSFDLVLNQTSAGSATVSAYGILESVTLGTVTWNTRPTSFTASLGGVSASGTGTKTINCTVDNKYESDAVVNNGIRLQENALSNSEFEALDDAGTAEPYITNITYISNDGKIRKTDADIPETVGSFLGFVQESGALDDYRPVTDRGVIDKTCAIGSTYYLSNTAGAISTTAGTHERIVGFGVGTNRLRVEKILNVSRGQTSFSPSGTSDDLVIPHNLGRMPRKVRIDWARSGSTNTFSYSYEGSVIVTAGGQSALQSYSPSAGNEAHQNSFSPEDSTGGTGWNGSVSFDEDSITIDVTSYTATSSIVLTWEAE